MKSMRIKIIITIVILLLVAIFFLYAGKVKATLTDSAITVKSTFVGGTIVPYDEITSLEYVRNFDIGTREVGMGTFKIQAGTYSNDFGKYELYSYSKVKAFIIVHHSDGVLVFNQSTVEATKDMYDHLFSKAM